MEDIFTKNNTLCRGRCHHAGSGWQTIEDEDEYGTPREGAIRITLEKLSKRIINELTSTW